MKICAIQYSNETNKFFHEIDTSEWTNDEFVKKYNESLQNVIIPQNCVIKIKYDMTNTYKYFISSQKENAYIWMQSTYKDIILSY